MTSNDITAQLPFEPNRQQQLVIEALARFCSPAAHDDSVFLLNGYAGTGKTSICGALVRALQADGRQAVLLGPTGRAAKVFSSFAHQPAFTIHRKIYRHPALGTFDSATRTPKENKHKDTLFIVDEASMIPSTGSSGENLLEDLIQYVYTGENCHLLLLGDTAQLPPVGCASSPAMDVDTLKGYGLRVTRATLTETARQSLQSGILFNATWLRQAMRQNPIPLPKITTSRFSDIKIITPEEMPETLYGAYNEQGLRESIVITRSNMRATAFNREIRSSVLYYDEELSAGDLILVSKNNYYWGAKTEDLDFIANGDVLCVDHVLSSEVRYGFRFADVDLSVPDTDIFFHAKIMLETLNSDSAALSQERYAQLYYAIMEDPELFGPEVPMDARLKALRTNPYWNALQVKYAYALTCHKAQGGQWHNVFVDMSYIPPESMGLEFYRWLYTAVTRARSNLFIIGTDTY